MIREIGIVIATRKRASLGRALEVAKWVFDKGTDAQAEAIQQLALQGLDSLSQELRYDREDAQYDDLVPLLRWRSAQLALSMANCGFEEASPVVRWLAIVREDPLPEVRYATERSFGRHQERS